MAAYVTNYISKVDNFGKLGWREIVRELDNQLRAAVTLHEGS